MESTATTVSPRRCAALLTGLLVLLIPASSAPARTWHVSQKELPQIDSGEQVRTIAEAVSRVEAGDTIVIHGGIYRERVQIDKSGTKDKPITLRAAQGEYVVLTGADHLTDWAAVPGEDHVYVTDWPHRFITWNERNTHPHDEFHRLIGRCEQVFINAYPMRQVLERDKLARGTFFVDLDAKTLYVCPADDGDLTNSRTTVEASVRDRILSIKGDYVNIKGLRFRYAANRAQQGAVEFDGDSLTVTDCVFEYTNSSGAEFGGDDITVRNCTFQHNGQLGFGASRCHRLHLTGCVCRNNNTKGFNRGWEAGGNKICLARGVVLEHSTFVENRGNGIWFDIGNEDCVVRNCLIANNEDAGLFYEISYGLHAHDNVIIANGLADSPGAWGAAAGISLSSSPGCTVERNLLLGNKEGFNFREQTRSTPNIDGDSEPVWNHDQTVRNNVFAFNRDAQVWGWFDIADERHWPGAMQGSREAAEALSLERLNLTLANNLYCPGPGQGLFHWGVTWKKHKKYTNLDDIREELAMAQGSETASFGVRDYAALDLRVPADSPALRLECYPRGAVPGVQLGILP
ncbi:MAG: right-handed parallel beta-helix repeat-containing protein [Phycisphaerales bacterium]|nr:MAG: right-handed parallel beta-helix repeat-containing protein [Phycisphaerales bacterium]